MTTSTLIVLLLALRSQASGLPQLQAGRRALPSDAVAKAASLLLVALGLCLMVSWLLLMTQKTNMTEAVFEAVSAFSTCGFTLGLTAKLDTFGQILIAATMLCGRLGLLTVVVAFGSSHKPHPITYPEESILMA